MSSELHPDVALTLALLGRHGPLPTAAAPEADNADYGAATAEVAGLRARLRVGKVTPTKVGLFVAVWRRAANGTTEPFPAEDERDTLIVATREGDRFGAFLFPKPDLIERDIVSRGATGGKRGFRVYPPWSATSNPQANRTKMWQSEWFVDLSDETATGRALAQTSAAAKTP